MQLNGKVVLIAGGSGALGQTVTPAFTQAGAQRHYGRSPCIAGADRSRAAMSADVTNETTVQRLVNDVVRKIGRIDALINLVGGFAMGRLEETDAALWQRMLTLNVTARIPALESHAPHMVARGTGRIVHVAAWAAIEPFPGAAAYLVSKSSLLALIKVLALESSGSGVTVNGVLPNTIDTPANRVSMPQADPSTWAKPESIAETLLFLASDEAAQISGAFIPIGARGSAKSAGKP